MDGYYATASMAFGFLPRKFDQFLYFVIQIFCYYV